MHRIPLTLRALMLLPLLALGVDHARVSLICGSRADSCLEVAGQGWLGPLGIAVLLVYAAGLSVAVARYARRRSGEGRTRMWLAGSIGIAAIFTGELLLASVIGDGSALGGGWIQALPLCAIAGAAAALVLRIVPAAAALWRGIRPAAARLRCPNMLFSAAPAVPGRAFSSVLALTAAGRAPPLTLG